MQSVFLMRGYEMRCTPRQTDDGKFAAWGEVTKVSFSREAAFRALGTFDTEVEAVTYAMKFSGEWLRRYGWCLCVMNYARTHPFEVERILPALRSACSRPSRTRFGDRSLRNSRHSA